MLLSSARTCKILTKSNTNSIALIHTFRKCSTAVVQAGEEDGILEQVGVDDRYKNERDVPFMFLPHTVKKAYHVHETSLSTPKLFDKYKWLSKTISTPGLPSNFVTSTTNVEKEELLNGFHDSLFHTVAYVKAFKNQKNPRYIPERINFSMLSNFLRLSMRYGEDALHLKPENSYLYHQPILETHWARDYKFYQTRFRPNFVLHTRHGFDMIEEMDALSPEMIEMIPGPYDPYAMNMYRQHTVHLRNRPGMDNVKANPLKHCHTSIMHNNRMTKDEQFFSLGVMTMFAQLASQAQSLGVLHGTELKEPIVTQCIVTNGHKMAFMVYQLNTLHMLDDKGVWNRCWYSPIMEMFERQEAPYMHMIYEDAETGPELKGFNKECFRLFINFIRNETS